VYIRAWPTDKNVEMAMKTDLEKTVFRLEKAFRENDVPKMQSMVTSDLKWTLRVPYPEIPCKGTGIGLDGLLNTIKTCQFEFNPLDSIAVSRTTVVSRLKFTSFSVEQLSKSFPIYDGILVHIFDDNGKVKEIVINDLLTEYAWVA